MTSRATPPMIRVTVMNGVLGSPPIGQLKMLKISSPDPVDSDSQLTIIEGALSAGSQPSPTLAATVQAVNTTRNTPKPAAPALMILVRCGPVSRAAQTSTRNGSATPAVALTAMAMVTSA